MGKTVESLEYHFEDCLAGDVNILTMPNWHIYNKKAEAAAKKNRRGLQCLCVDNNGKVLVDEAVEWKNS